VLTLDFLGKRHPGGATLNPPFLLKMLRSARAGRKGQSTVFGDAKTWTPAVAALLNGALGHSLDFDDTHADSSLHPSAPVVAARSRSANWSAPPARRATAIVAAMRSAAVGNALDPTSHYARGFHPPHGRTYGGGSRGKLFGCRKIGSLQLRRVRQARPRIAEFLVNGAWNKRYRSAAAMNGVIAATWRATISSGDESVEGKHGLLVGYSDNAHSDKAVAGLGRYLRNHEDRRQTYRAAATPTPRSMR